MLFAEQTAAVFFQTAYKINGTPVPHIRSHYYASIFLQHHPVCRHLFARFAGGVVLVRTRFVTECPDSISGGRLKSFQTASALSGALLRYYSARTFLTTTVSANSSGMVRPPSVKIIRFAFSQTNKNPASPCPPSPKTIPAAVIITTSQKSAGDRSDLTTRLTFLDRGRLKSFRRPLGAERIKARVATVFISFLSA